jgi:hypothetical protein
MRPPFDFLNRSPAPPILGGLFLCLLLSGCSPRPATVQAAPPAPPAPEGDTLAPGVIHRAIPTTGAAGVDLIDVDLDHTGARWTIQTRGIQMANGRVVGQALTPRDWLTRLGGLAAVNGGYFGGEDEQGRKEFVGLLVQRGRVRHAAPPLHGSGSATIRRGQYVRSAFGLTADGKPRIVWAATDAGRPQSLRAYPGPMSGRGTAWRVAEALGCGPTLISGGKVVVTQYGERLVSPGPRPRTFVAYDLVNGQPKHLLAGMASGSDFHALAAFLAAYFPRYDGTRAEAAMCLDGGASTQMTYRQNETLHAPLDTGVTVPDALVLLPTR